MKPHEANWRVRKVPLEDPSGISFEDEAIVNESGERLFIADKASIRDLQLAAQAPRMARALAALLSSSCNCVVGCSCPHGKLELRALDVLRAAGVLS